MLAAAVQQRQPFTKQVGISTPELGTELPEAECRAHSRGNTPEAQVLQATCVQPNNIYGMTVAS